MNEETPIAIGSSDQDVEAFVKSTLTQPKGGAVAWCKRCSRKHRRGPCDMVLAERVSKAGNKTFRWVHKGFE